MSKESIYRVSIYIKASTSKIKVLVLRVCKGSPSMLEKSYSTFSVERIFYSGKFEVPLFLNGK